MNQPRLSRSIVLLMAVATGISVANLYYCQPLLELISGDLGISAASAGALVTMTQIGYALGLLFVLPLGDLLERRGLIVGLSLACVGALILTATAQNAPGCSPPRSCWGCSPSSRRSWCRSRRPSPSRGSRAPWWAS